MTREQLEALSNRELDAWIAEKVMDWKRAKAACFPGEDWWSLGDFITKRVLEFQPSEDRNAAALVLEKLGELGLQVAWEHEMLRLFLIAALKHSESYGYSFVMATPRTWMIAAVLAWEGRK